MGGHKHQRVGSVQLVHGRAQGCFNRGSAQALLGDNISDNLRVAGGVENSAGKLQTVSEPGGIAKVAVVGQGHFPFLMVHLYGLAVPAPAASGGAVAHMAHPHVSFRQAAQRLWGEHLSQQANVLMGREDAVVVYYNPAALLSPVLKGKKAVIAELGRLCAVWQPHTENSAFLMYTHARLSFILRWPHSLPALLPTGRLLYSPPIPGWASKNHRLAVPGQDSISQTTLYTAGLLS